MGDQRSLFLSKKQLSFDLLMICDIQISAAFSSCILVTGLVSKFLVTGLEYYRTLSVCALANECCRDVSTNLQI